MAKGGKEWASRIKGEVQKSIIGQDEVIERLLVALLSNGHVLLEGLPGLAKTLLIKSLGTAMGLEFERIQFTPDLLPSDVVGTMVFQPKEGNFRVHRGPVFANLLLADEINRAPAKVQSALLEAMQEHRVTGFHIRGAAAVDVIGVAMGRDVVGDRDGVEVPGQQHPGRPAEVGAGQHCVAVADDLVVGLCPKGSLDLVGNPTLVARHAGDVDEGGGQIDRIRAKVKHN
jgi:hypothetical protein